MAAVLQCVKHYQRNIERGDADDKRTLRCIEKLYHLPVTVQLLQDTGVGRTVNALRKGEGEVASAARALVAKWKQMVAEEEELENNQQTDNEPHCSYSSRDEARLSENTSKYQNSPKNENVYKHKYNDDHKRSDSYKRKDDGNDRHRKDDGRSGEENEYSDKDRKRKNDREREESKHAKLRKLDSDDSSHDDDSNSDSNDDDDEDDDDDNAGNRNSEASNSERASNEGSAHSDASDSSSSDSDREVATNLKEQHPKVSADSHGSFSNKHSERSSNWESNKHESNHHKSKSSNHSSDKPSSSLSKSSSKSSSKHVTDEKKPASNEDSRKSSREAHESKHSSHSGRSESNSVSKSHHEKSDKYAKQSGDKEKTSNKDKSSSGKDKYSKDSNGKGSSSTREIHTSKDSHSSKESHSSRESLSGKSLHSSKSTHSSKEKEAHGSSREKHSSSREKRDESKDKHSSNKDKEKHSDKNKFADDKQSKERKTSVVEKKTEKYSSVDIKKESSSSSSKHEHRKDDDQRKRDHQGNDKKSSSKRDSSSKEKSVSKSNSSSKADAAKTKPKESNSDHSSEKKRKIYHTHEGIDGGSGASFAEALGMITPSKMQLVSKKKASNNKYSTPDAHEDISNSRNKSSVDVTTPSLLHPSTKLAPLQPLSVSVSALPDISPNYVPRPAPKLIDVPHPTSISEEEALKVVMNTKNQRTKVYSGNKVNNGNVPSLYDLCVIVLQENINALEYTGGVPYDIIKPVVDKASPDQLFILEHFNPYLIEDTDPLWQCHANKRFRNKQRQEFESWREMFLRCNDEQEAKLKSLTANIKMAQDKSQPVRQTKMAYVDSAVKPPRGIARKQAIHGTARKPVASPAARVASLANHMVFNAANAVGVGASSSSAASRPSSSFIKPKKAPLMQKALQFMKGRSKR